MLYCEGCEALYEGERCPLCGHAQGRPPREDDPCFLTERGQIQSDMLVDILKQNGIPSLVKGCAGAGLTAYTGRMLEEYRIYVPYALFEQAREWMNAFFEGAPVEEDEAEEEGTEQAEETEEEEP